MKNSIGHRTVYLHIHKEPKKWSWCWFMRKEVKILLIVKLSKTSESSLNLALVDNFTGNCWQSFVANHHTRSAFKTIRCHWLKIQEMMDVPEVEVLCWNVEDEKLFLLGELRKKIGILIRLGLFRQVIRWVTTSGETSDFVKGNSCFMMPINYERPWQGTISTGKWCSCGFWNCLSIFEMSNEPLRKFERFFGEYGFTVDWWNWIISFDGFGENLTGFDQYLLTEQ